MLVLEELGARGTDLAEMDPVSYFILGRREKEEKMGQDPILRLPLLAASCILRGNRRKAGWDDRSYMITTSLSQQFHPNKMHVFSVLTLCPHYIMTPVCFSVLLLPLNYSMGNQEQLNPL